MGGNCASPKNDNLTRPQRNGGQKEDAMKTAMNRSRFTMVMVAVVAILIAAVLVLPGCGGSPTEPKPDPTPTPTPTPQTFVFTLADAGVTPKSVNANPGDTVVFRNISAQDRQISGNSGTLSSPRIVSGGEWSTKMPDFGEARVLTFYDSFHPSDSTFFGTINLSTKL